MCLGERSSWNFWSVKIVIKLFISIWILLISFKIKLRFKIWEIFLEYIFPKALWIFSNIKFLFLLSNLFRRIFRNTFFVFIDIFIFILYVTCKIVLILIWCVFLVTFFSTPFDPTKIILLVLFWVSTFLSTYFK